MPSMEDGATLRDQGLHMIRMLKWAQKCVKQGGTAGSFISPVPAEKQGWAFLLVISAFHHFCEGTDPRKGDSYVCNREEDPLQNLS